MGVSRVKLCIGASEDHDDAHEAREGDGELCQSEKCVGAFDQPGSPVPNGVRRRGPGASSDSLPGREPSSARTPELGFSALLVLR